MMARVIDLCNALMLLITITMAETVLQGFLADDEKCLGILEFNSKAKNCIPWFWSCINQGGQNVGTKMVHNKYRYNNQITNK